ncbi:MAG: hypothetical protein O2871_00085 [bacterium]|jgi:nanoRNase/pAp phosphatase (c-di-AMP/oligoRNAs hydrolase)|nr:hypothetical protein [bacterium]
MEINTNELIKKGKTIAVIPYDKISEDGLASAFAIYIALKESGASVDFLYKGAVSETLKGLISDSVKISSTTPEKHLVISVDYLDKSIEEVNYSIEDNKLNLILKPISDNFTADKIEHKVMGGSYDTTITIGCWNLDKIEMVKENPDSFTKTSIINIDNTANNEKFGTINIIGNEIDNISLLVLQTIASWNIKIPKKSAELLLKSINS